MSEVELPEGWASTDLGTVCQKGEQRKPLGEETFYYIDIASIDRDTKKIVEPQLLEGANAPSRARKVIETNDVLVSTTRPNLNAVAMVSEHLDNQIASTGFEVLRPFGVNSKFVFQIVKSQRFIDEMSAKVQGALYPAIKGTDVRAFQIHLPPLAEQHEIAARLDTLLAQVDSIKSRLDGVPAILKRFRQAVLAAAVSGRLTEEWRGAYLDTSENGYFEQLKKEKDLLIFKKEVKKDLGFIKGEEIFSIPEKWSFIQFGSIATKITDGEHSTPKRVELGHYLLSARNVRDGFIDVSNVDYVDDEEFVKLRKRCDPNKNDILISCSGSVGRVSLVDKSNTYVMVRSAALIKTIQNLINNKYIMYALQSLYLQKEIEKKSKSTAQSNLFLGQIKELSIPLPHLSEQTEIVSRVEILFAFADQIEARLKEAQAQVNQLTQSILAKAFRGELTAQWRKEHPELISGENSAVALLQRIQAEREKASKITKSWQKKGVKSKRPKEIQSVTKALQNI